MAADDGEDRSAGKTASPTTQSGQAYVPVIGIGASAGGLEALRELLAAAPADMGACFIFVQHLDPTHESMLTDLLSRCTEMAVVQAAGGLAVAPNTVIVIQPDTTWTLRGGALHVDQPAPPRAQRMPIDRFFESLADNMGNRAIAIILSGTGSDGVQGLRAIKEAGGFALAQDPDQAKYDSMPRKAATAGLVDEILAPEDMPARLTELLSSLRQEDAISGEEQQRRVAREQLTKIGSLIRRETGHDFRHYKQPTLIRRIQRRMHLLRLTDIGDYIQRLRDDKDEVRELVRDLLVTVTGFFRDPDAFESLETRVLDPLVESTDDGGHIRVWVPGCATGEDSYSIAMALKDRVDRSGKSIRLQIFATDLDEAALETPPLRRLSRFGGRLCARAVSEALLPHRGQRLQGQ